MKYKSFQLAQFKALAEGQGQFEAIVAVFNNVDRAGERILPGAFTQSLANWRKSGDPIPVLFSHEWANLDAHIGVVLEAKELFPGAPELSADLSALGGLYIKAKLDIEEPSAKRVWQLMSQRRLKSLSFSYDVVASREVGEQGKAAPNHWLDLVTLDLLEVGPCLVGMNPDTALIGVKQVGFKPYPNEHACRLREPGDFEDDSFRRTTRKHEDKEYAVILGRLKGEDVLTEQAYRYPTETWSASEARSHCQTHDGTFEAAAEKAGARHTGKEFREIQQIHDLTIALGAKCAGSDDSDEGAGSDDQGQNGKSVVPRNLQTLAIQIARELFNLEE